MSKQTRSRARRACKGWTARSQIPHYSACTIGGHLNRNNDGPPGNTVIWRGMARLTDIEIGFQLGIQLVGN